MAEILLIDTNTTPFNEAFPVYPIGLDYLQGALARQGLGRAELLDLTRGGGPLPRPDLAERQARSLALIKDRLAGRAWDVIGLSLRNIDSTFPLPEGDPNLHYFLPQLSAYLDCVQGHAGPGAQVILGGTAFSMMPEAFLAGRPATWRGIVGPAETALPELVQDLAAGREVARVSRRAPQGLGTLQNSALLASYLGLPVSESTFGLRTKVGCGQACGYCPYPLINGPGQVLKTPGAVVEEIAFLAAAQDGGPRGQGLRFMFADDIFNRPLEHAKAVLRAMLERESLPASWHAYLDPGNLDQEFLELICQTNGWSRRIDDQGVSRRVMFFPFDIESGCDRILARLRKPYTSQKILAAVQAFREVTGRWLESGRLYRAGFGFHLLLGYPGEDEGSVAETCRLINQTRPLQIAVQLGVRVYPGTPLAKETKGQVWREEQDLNRPTFAPLDDRAVLEWLRQHLDESYDRLARRGNMLLISQGDN
ncbi:MAG: B12-binding domain-containing radical SAM protein [Pseudomonadota bacterium]